MMDDASTPAPGRSAGALLRLRLAGLGAGAAMWLAVPATSAQEALDLARYFGFDSPRPIISDRGAGPVIVADVNGDGRNDIVIVNNRKSRLELHLQRAAERTDEELERAHRVNELPPSPWYDREYVSVAHQVQAVRAMDVDGDGALDLIYAGQPAEIVTLRQGSPLKFDVMSRRRVRGLAASRTAFAVADVQGDERPEVLATVAGKIHVFPLSTAGVLGDPVELGAGGAGESILAFFAEDFDGDGLTDVLGAIPESAAPLRLWVQSKALRTGAGAEREGGAPARAGKNGLLGPELRFEMPALREVEPVRFPGRPAAAVGVIERATRRMVFYDFASLRIDPSSSAPGAEREVQAEVYSFVGGAATDRSLVLADLDGDGLTDLLATDKVGNRVILHRQREGMGLTGGEPHSAFKDPKTIAAGQWDGEGPLEVFVLSEEEKTVGVSRYDASARRLGFPQPIQLATAGSTPVAMSYVKLADGPAVAVVVRDRRDHTLELHRPPVAGGAPPAPKTLPLEGVNRPPQSILPADIDHDGDIDLLLFTPGEPMVVVRVGPGGTPTDVLTDKTMPQFGLVQAAGPDNTALLDVDGDGRAELLIASKNFVRACSFDVAAGWRVVEQITVSDPTTDFTGLAVLRRGDADKGARVVASDRANGRLVVMSPEFGAWRVTDTLRLPGFSVNAIAAGSFTGDGEPGLLASSSESFGVVRLAGRRAALESFAAHRADTEQRLQHEMSTGDLNGDGFVDLVVLDAQEQMCEIYTFSASRKLNAATEFKVFESRLFSQGDSRQFEPSDAVVADVTGDGADDLLLIVHDRVIVYPQMTRPAE